MKKILHISDLHFGRADLRIAEALYEDVQTQFPDIIVVSGDLTQRARTSQFLAAKDYLKRFPFPMLIVPGNHDIPLYDVLRRFFAPLKRYREYITGVLDPFYYDGELVVCGINTARSLTWKEGRISVAQIRNMRERMCSIPNHIPKVVVTHHPFIPPSGEDGVKLVGHARKALNIVDECGIDLLLAGHLHRQYSGAIKPFYPHIIRSTVAVQAGTATSTRVRHEPNAYNIIHIDSTRIEVEVRIWNGMRFVHSEMISYNMANDM